MLRLRIWLVPLLLLTIIMLPLGCSSPHNSAISRLGVPGVDASDIAVIINQPTADELLMVPNHERYDADDSESYLLLLPTYNGVRIEVISLVWQDEDLREHEVLYSADKTKDGYALLLRAERPCGMPWLKIRVGNQAGTVEYLISENGESGTPKMEYLRPR